MTENLLQNGLELTIYGMGTVFVFLVLLIFVTRAMSWMVLRFDNPVSGEITGRREAGQPAAIQEQGELIAVITAAVQHYKNSRNK